MNKKFVAILLSLSLAAVLVFSLMGGASADPGPTGEAQGVPIDPGPGAPRFDVLQPASTTAVSELPASVVTVLAEPTPRPAGAELEAQESDAVTALGTAPSGSTSSEVDVAEVNGMLCLFAAGSEYEGAALGSCLSVPQAEAGEGYVAIPDVSPGLVRIIGLAPDGVTTIAVDSGEDGTVDKNVAVASNTYQVDVEDVPTILTGLTESGDVAFQMKLPIGGLASSLQQEK